MGSRPYNAILRLTQYTPRQPRAELFPYGWASRALPSILKTFLQLDPWHETSLEVVFDMGSIGEGAIVKRTRQVKCKEAREMNVYSRAISGDMDGSSVEQIYESRLLIIPSLCSRLLVSRIAYSTAVSSSRKQRDSTHTRSYVADRTGNGQPWRHEPGLAAVLNAVHMS